MQRKFKIKAMDLLILLKYKKVEKEKSTSHFWICVALTELHDFEIKDVII